MLILLEDFTPLSFSDYVKLARINESFQNLLPHNVVGKQKHAHEVFSMLQKSYEDQGGVHGNGFKSPEDMIKNVPMWKLHHKDGKIRAVSLYKDAHHTGRKMVAIATDGTPEGKKSATEMLSADLKQKRAHTELSGKALSHIKKHTNLTDHLHTFDQAKEYHKARGDEISRPADNDPEVLRHPELKDHMYKNIK